MSYNYLPKPTSPEKAVVPVTYSDNYVPVNYKDVKLLINGSDLIIQSGEDKLILPLAAKLASMDPNIFTFTFQDGVTINASELISKSQLISNMPKLIENNESDNSQKTELKGQDADEIIEPVAKDAVEIIIVEDLDSKLQKNEQSMQDLEKYISKQSASSSKDSDIDTAEYVSQISASDTAETSKETFIDEAHIVDEIQITDNDDSENPSEVNIPSITLLQIKSVVDQNTKTWISGTGNEESTTSGDFRSQYENVLIDLSAETADWTIYANNTQMIPAGQIGRIVEVTDAMSVTSVTGQLSNMTVITADSALGKQYGLKANQFMILYPEGSKTSFTLSYSYIDNDGQTVTDNATFDVVNNPAVIFDSTGHVQLASSKNNVDIVAGSGDDTIFAGNQNGHYNGGAGTNTVNYSELDESLTIDLNNGKTTSDHTHHTLENIQNVVGSNNGDIIIGHQTVSNNIIGGDGDDKIMTGGGNNVIDGGEGLNTISYETAASGVHVDLSNNVATDNGNGGKDSIKNIQNIIGSAYDDVLIGDDQDNIINGGEGDDILSGMGGNNILNGGEGNNTADYSQAASGINVDLIQSQNQVIKNGFGGQDTLINIQKIVGSDHNDNFRTGVGTTHIDGGAGDDRFLIGGNEASITFIHGNSGNNTYYAGAGFNNYIGGTGHDTVDYRLASSSVNIDFEKNVVYDNGFAGIDVFKNIDKVVGTKFDDYFVLGNGDHEVDGGLGNNIFIAGSGNNKINGGSQGMGYVNTVDYSNAGSGLDMDLVSGNVANNGFGGQDNLTNIQKIIASDFDDVIYSSGNDLSIFAGAGDDIVYGNDGNDTIDGGSGNNTLRYDKLQDGVKIDLSTGQVSKASGVDQFTNFNNFVGSNYNDTFIAAAGNQIIDGGAGHDIISYKGIAGKMIAHLDENKIYDGVQDRELFQHTIKNIDEVHFSNAWGNQGFTNKQGNTKFVGGSSDDFFYVLGGSNELIGGGGFDTVSYQHSNTGKGIVADLDRNGSGTVTQNSYDNVDHLQNIGVIIGTQYDDKIKSGGEIRGMTGNDTIEGVGNAMVSYVGVSKVDVDLEKGTALKTNGTDKLININNVKVGSGDSIVHGNANNNNIIGQGGNDTFYASAGNDSYDGGNGYDTLIYNQLKSNTTINMDLTTNKITKSGGLGTDTVKNVEKIIATKGNDLFKISSLNDLNNYRSIDGGDGFDVVQKSGKSSYFFFGSSSIFKHIERFEFNDKASDNISVDLSSIFDVMDQNRIEFVLDSNDNLAVINSSSWSHSVNGSTETWTDGTHELVVNRV